MNETGDWFKGDFTEFWTKAGYDISDWVTGDFVDFWKAQGKDINDAFKEVGISAAECFKDDCLKATFAAGSCSACLMEVEPACEICIEAIADLATN